MYNNLQNEVQFSRKSNADSGTAENGNQGTKDQIIKSIDSVILKTVSGATLEGQGLKQVTTGNTVKTTLDGLVNSINEKIIDVLNTQLALEQQRIYNLESTAGSETSEGLVKSLKDLKEKVTEMFPQEAPPHINIVGEH